MTFFTGTSPLSEFPLTKLVPSKICGKHCNHKTTLKMQKTYPVVQVMIQVLKGGREVEK